MWKCSVAKVDVSFLESSQVIHFRGGVTSTQRALNCDYVPWQRQEERASSRCYKLNCTLHLLQREVLVRRSPEIHSIRNLQRLTPSLFVSGLQTWLGVGQYRAMGATVIPGLCV